MAPACAPFMKSAWPARSGRVVAGISAGGGGRGRAGAASASARRSASSGSRSPNGSGHASMQRPHALHCARSSSTGMTPLVGWTSVPMVMQCWAQDSMQRPQPLQYSRRIAGFFRAAVLAISPLPAEKGGHSATVALPFRNSPGSVF